LIVAYLLLGILLLGSAIVAIRSVSLIRAAVALAMGSSALAVLFFLQDAPLAGSVQLSVGAGLVSALFIIAISLTESMRGVKRED
jgi:NADH:ubiquinone oxidoreductase subunit 6 (subunit J)